MADQHANSPSLPAWARTLQDILPYVLEKAEHAEEEAARAAALAERNAARLRGVESAGAILRGALGAREQGAQGHAAAVGQENPRHAKPKRDRHGLFSIPGGMAALVPVALLAHASAGPLMAAVGTRVACRTRWGATLAVVLLLGLAGAIAVPRAADGDHGRPAVTVRPAARPPCGTRDRACPPGGLSP